MPSSHSAGALAYATAATLALPPAGVVLVPIAVLVAWSRVATARHFPTDLLVGGALGVTTGAAVHVALRPRPARRDDPDRPTGELQTDVAGGPTFPSPLLG
jgi:membrane-associated phospholipid phosphatase